MKKTKDWETKKVWLFTKYILTEPVRQIYTLLRSSPKKLYHPKAWIYIFTVSLIYSIVARDRLGALLSIIMIIIFSLIKEYESGEFMYYYRQKYKKQIKQDDIPSQKDQNHL